MTPEQEEQVRRALADAARETPSMPPRVAERLDDVLAELVSTREDTAAEAVRPTGAGERRGRWSTLPAAAAVVCLVALGGTAILRSTTPSDTGAAPSARASRTVAGAAPSVGGEAEGALPLPRLHRATLQRDVRLVLAATPLSDGARKAGLPGSSGLQGLAQPSPDVGCSARSVPRRADVIDVLLDGREATLVVSAPRGGTREARVYLCQDPSVPVATTRVTGP